MRLFLLSCFVLSATCAPQTNFGPKINERLGLLANSLGLNPTADSSSQSAALTAGETSQDSSGQLPSGRVPTGGEIGAQSQVEIIEEQTQCCCVPESDQCDDPFANEDLVGLGLIDPRKKPTSLSTRIVNRPGSGASEPQVASCPVGQKACCYDSDLDLSVFGRTCLKPHSVNNVSWVQGCQERIVTGGSQAQCGTRNFAGPVSGLSHGQVSPGEFPWTCILLNQNNDFIGTCAIIPNDSSNNNNVPTRKVVTAAHKMKALEQTDLLKVRVGEYDASGFFPPEVQAHEEYTVTRILKHPQMSNTRLSNDLAIVSNAQCEASLKTALNAQKPGAGDRFRLHPCEICAGSEVGKDACTGDGGSPLVCQAESGRWTVVGLVAWGVGLCLRPSRCLCEDVPLQGLD